MLQIIAVVDDLGPISEDRIQTIKLRDVALLSGDFCLGEMRAIYFLTPDEQKVVNEALRTSGIME